MKFAIIALAIMGSASSAFAAVECAEDATTLYSCTAAPQAGDSEAISGTFDSIAICSDAAGTSMVAEKSGEADSLPVEVSSRQGGVSYTVVIPGELVKSGGEEIATPPTTVSMNLPTGLSPRVKTVTGKLHVDFGGAVDGSTTFSCDIVR